MLSSKTWLVSHANEQWETSNAAPPPPPPQAELSKLVCYDNQLNTLTQTEEERVLKLLKYSIKMHTVIQIWTFLHTVNAWGLAVE